MIRSGLVGNPFTSEYLWGIGIARQEDGGDRVDPTTDPTRPETTFQFGLIGPLVQINVTVPFGSSFLIGNNISGTLSGLRANFIAPIVDEASITRTSVRIRIPAGGATLTPQGGQTVQHLLRLSPVDGSPGTDVTNPRTINTITGLKPGTGYVVSRSQLLLAGNIVQRQLYRYTSFRTASGVLTTAVASTAVTLIAAGHGFRPITIPTQTRQSAVVLNANLNEGGGARAGVTLRFSARVRGFSDYDRSRTGSAAGIRGSVWIPTFWFVRYAEMLPGVIAAARAGNREWELLFPFEVVGRRMELYVRGGATLGQVDVRLRGNFVLQTERLYDDDGNQRPEATIDGAVAFQTWLYTHSESEETSDGTPLGTLENLEPSGQVRRRGFVQDPDGLNYSIAKTTPFDIFYRMVGLDVLDRDTLFPQPNGG